MLRHPSPARRAHGRRARRVRAVAGLVATVLVVVGGLAACSSSGGAGGAPGGEAGASPAPTTGVGSCGDVEPGVVVDRTLAVVHFGTESICPGWVTVEQGTQVTFANDDAVERTVVVTATQLPDAAELARFTIPAGGRQPLDTRDVAMMGFRTDALPGFRGTVEVVAPGAAMQH